MAKRKRNAKNEETKIETTDVVQQTEESVQKEESPATDAGSSEGTEDSKTESCEVCEIGSTIGEGTHEGHDEATNSKSENSVGEAPPEKAKKPRKSSPKQEKAKHKTEEVKKAKPSVFDIVRWRRLGRR